MKYFLNVNGEEHEVELRERLGELEVKVNGQRLDIDYEEVDRLGQVAARIGNQSYAVSIEGDAHTCTVSMAGQLYGIEIEDERERAAHAAERERSGGGGLVKSVMPGVVVDCLVAEGDTVEAGQALLILEAMKMQNEIAAPTSGTVRRVHVAKGEAVPGGAPLITLEGE